MPANPEIVEYIKQAAIKRGIDPKTALAVSRSEALNVFDPSKPDRGGDLGSSFGPFQLHYGGMTPSMPNPGLGDAFTKATGLHASDPSTWRQQIDFALDTAKQDGWRQWMGAANTGIPRWAGIKTPGVGGEQKASEPQTAQVPQYPGQPPLSQPTSTPEKPWGGTVTKEVQGPVKPASPYGPQFGPPMAPATQPTMVAEAKKKEGWRDLLAKAAAGWKPPPVALADTALTGMAIPRAARIDQPEVSMFDPNAIANQRNQLAMAMQKLNTGKLFL
jgi:hypothetical protein